MFQDTFQFYKNYKIARSRVHNDIIEFIEALPPVDSPEALGLHPNADVTYVVSLKKERYKFSFCLFFS